MLVLQFSLSAILFLFLFFYNTKSLRYDHFFSKKFLKLVHNIAFKEIFMKLLFKIVCLSLLITNATNPKTSWGEFLVGAAIGVSGIALLNYSRTISENDTNNLEKYIHERMELMKMGATIFDNRYTSHYFLEGGRTVSMPYHEINIQYPKIEDKTKLNAIKIQGKKVEELHALKNLYALGYPLALGGSIVLLITGGIPVVSYIIENGKS